MTPMTDEQFDAAGPGAAIIEGMRARSEEARLLKVEAEKDAMIKALADALRAVRPASRPPGCWCPPSRGATDHSIPCKAANAAIAMVLP